MVPFAVADVDTAHVLIVGSNAFGFLLYDGTDCSHLSHIIVNFLETHDLLYKHQYGFHQNHTTAHPILQLLKDISNDNDKNSKDVTLAVFLDLSKAFDTISHKILINKLEHYGIRGICKNWFANYLCNRLQYTDIDGFQSSRMHISTGVPQGSILGPVLI